MKYNQNFRKKKSLVFLRNLKLPYFFSTGKSKRKTAPLLPQNGMLLFVRVFKKYFPMLEIVGKIQKKPFKIRLFRYFYIFW